MSAMEMRNLESEIALLSYGEQLSLMAYLVKQLQNRGEGDGFEGDAAARNGLDEAIREMENGEYDTYENFDDFLAEVANEA